MDIDEAGRHRQPGRIEILLRLAEAWSDGDDPAARDTEVGVDGRAAAAVVDHAAPDRELVAHSYSAAASICLRLSAVAARSSVLFAGSMTTP